METPKITESTESLVDRNTYTTARLKATPAVADLVAPLDDAIAAVKRAHEHYEAIHVSVVSAMALRDVANGEADQLMRRFFRLCQAEDGAGRQAGRVARYFPGGLAAVIYGPIPDQPHEMRIVAARAESDEKGELAAFAPLMLQKAETLEEQVADHDVMIGQQEVAFGAVQTARGEWIAKLVKVYGDLVSRLGKAKAETFFKRMVKSRKRVIQGPDPTPA